MPGVILGIQPSLALSVPREGYNNPPISGENLIGLSRARRPHNAIFVNFEEDEVPAQPLEAAVQTWRRVCTNPVDWKVEGELKKVSCPWPGPAASSAPRPVPSAARPVWIGSLAPGGFHFQVSARNQHEPASPGGGCFLEASKRRLSVAKSAPAAWDSGLQDAFFQLFIPWSMTCQTGHLLCARPRASSR